MRRPSSRLRLVLMLALASAGLWLRGAPRSADDAWAMAQGWLAAARNAPLGGRLGAASEIEPLAVNGQTVGYLFTLQPRGFIVTSADDEVEPVIAFSRSGRPVLTEGSPLADLLFSDLPQRLSAVSATGPAALTAAPSAAARKWALFSAAASGVSALANSGLSSPPSDLRVAPLVQSRWGQDDVAGLPCYNYYTPSNYVCGCVATSWGQIMRYHQFPTNGIGALTRTVLVDGVSLSATTRGGNGSGGPYAWSQMPLAPDGSLTAAQRQAIGALTFDIGVAISTTSGGLLTEYTETSTSAYMPPSVLTGTFKFASGYRFDSTVDWEDAINANLDAGYPVNVLLPGHAVVCDGYGFLSGTAYHHLNMGWDGLDDAWYTLGDLIAGGYIFSGIDYIYANIFPDSAGEVVSGRVLDNSGSPIANATVTLMPGGRTDITDSAGIYAFRGIGSGASVTLTAAKSGFTFAPKSVTLGSSQNYTSICGNRWGNDFTGALSGSYRMVSGIITNSAGIGISGVNVAFSNGGGETATDPGGNFAQALPIGWSGTVTPGFPSAYFNPASYAVANLQTDLAGLNYRGTLVCYVKADAHGAADGSSWADAYTNLATALAGTPAAVELWVATGTYRPGAARESAFFFNAGQAVYGGFTGTETRREQRNWYRYATVLSGDIGVLNTVTDNCYSVIRGAAGARVDGFTVTGGNANYKVNSGTVDELSQGLGGGVFVWTGNVIPSSNESLSFVVDHCQIVGNRAVRTAGPGTQGQGGGLFGCLVRNSLVRGNAADAGGGVTFCRVEASTVASNSASVTAGGTLWVAVRNGIVYYNTPNNYYTDSSSMTNTCTTPAFSGSGNITAAPTFVNAPAGNFMIATNSPCKNAGSALPWMASAQDYFGDSRVSGAAPDMGAYEVQTTHPAYAQLPESPLKSGASFASTVLTRYGWSYRLQYRNNLLSGSWQNVAGAAAAAVGDGTAKSLKDGSAPSTARFYRVLAQ